MDKFILCIKYLCLALIQGISEVLPISSSAHLVIFENLLGIKGDSLAFEIFLHLASLIAVVLFLRKQIVSLIKGFILFVFKKNKDYSLEFKICISLVISTIPVVIIALLFGGLIDSLISRVWLIGILLLINGLLLIFLTRINGTKTINEFNYTDALVIGLTQVCGVMPGISRSGSCLYGAFIRRLEKKTAADYAFLLFIPSVLGAFVLNIKDIGKFIIDQNIYIYLLCFIVTIVITYLSFKILLKVISRGKLKYFGFYCLLIGVFALIYGLLK